MIAACEQYGLRTPEFRQAEDFRTIIFRKTKESDVNEKVTESGKKVTEFAEKSNGVGQKSNEVTSESNRVRLTAKQRKVLESCDEMPRTAQEILEMVGVKYQTKTREQYINKLVLTGVLRPTTTKPNDPNRKYITSHDEE